MDRRNFLKLAAALPVVGPAAVKAASDHPGKAIYESVLAEAVKVNPKPLTIYAIGVDASDYKPLCDYLGWDRKRDGLLQVRGVSVWETHTVDLTYGDWTYHTLGEKAKV